MRSGSQKSRSGAAVVVFKNGQIVQAATDNLRDTLGNILISRGLITEADLSAALEIQRGLKGSKRLGQILVEQGRIPQGTLESAIREQIENMVYSLLAWDDGFFNFEVGEVAPSDKIEVSTQEFLLKSGGLNPEYLLSLQGGGPYCVIGVAVAVLIMITSGYLIMMKIADIEV